jgi:hypothetical protein
MGHPFPWVIESLDLGSFSWVVESLELKRFTWVSCEVELGNATVVEGFTLRRLIERAGFLRDLSLRF